MADIQQLSPHWHTDVELLFLLDGSLSVMVDSERYTMQPGQIVLFNSNAIHAMEGVDGSNLVMVLQFHPDLYMADYERTTGFYFHLNTTDTTGTYANIGALQALLAKIGLEAYQRRRERHTVMPVSVGSGVPSYFTVNPKQGYDLLHGYIAT